MATSISLGPAADRRAQLARRIRLLVAATITYNVIEAIVAILLPRRVLLWPLLSRRSQIGPDSTLGVPGEKRQARHQLETSQRPDGARLGSLLPVQPSRLPR